MFKTKDVPVIVSLARSKSAKTSLVNKPRPPSPSEMVGSIDPMCNRLVGQAAHIDEEEVAALVLLRCCPDPSCCHYSCRHGRTHSYQGATARRTLEDEASGADSALACSTPADLLERYVTSIRQRVVTFLKDIHLKGKSDYHYRCTQENL